MTTHATDAPVIFAVDAQNNIVLTEGSWCFFAEENGGEHLADILGDSLWDHIADPGMQLFFQGLIDEMRRKKLRYISYLYRCDCPPEERLYRMMVEQEDRGVIRFTSFVERSDEKNHAASQVFTSTEFNLHICPNCLKVHVENVWIDICEALTAHEILKDNPFFKLTMTPCPCT